MNTEDVIEKRRLARIDKRQSDDRLVDFHRKAVDALLDQRDGERVRRLALERVEKWDSEQLCNPRYVKAWRAILNMPVASMCESILTSDPDGVSFGGFLFFENQDEFELLSFTTNIPIHDLLECIHFVDDFFGNFFFEIPQYKMLCMKGVPGIIRGGGAFVRRNVFGIKNYSEKYGAASWLLAKWHNAIYWTLEPYLKQHAKPQ